MPIFWQIESSWKNRKDSATVKAVTTHAQILKNNFSTKMTHDELPHSYTSNYNSTAPLTTSDLTTIPLIQYESYLLKIDSFWTQSRCNVDAQNFLFKAMTKWLRNNFSVTLSFPTMTQWFFCYMIYITWPIQYESYDKLRLWRNGYVIIFLLRNHTFIM